MPDTPAPALDLGVLVERLRAAGFRVDTRQYLTAHELLLAYAASGVQLGADVPRLTACLGPIFCTSPDEQQRFANEVAEWLQVRREQARPKAASRTARPFQPWKRARWWVGPVIAVLVIGAVCGLLAARYYLPIETKGAVQVQLEDGRVVPPSGAEGDVTLFEGTTPLDVGSDGTFVVRVARGQVVTITARYKNYPEVTQDVSGGMAAAPLLTLMPPVAPTPIQPENRTGAGREPTGVVLSGETVTTRVRWPVVAAAALGAALLALGLLSGIDRIRRRLALGQLPVHEDPEAVTLSLPEAHVVPASEADLRRAAIALRRPRESAALELDIDDTVDLTVRNAGFFQPRFSARKAMPEYVVLVSRRTPSDHQARTFDTILKHLSDQDVVLDFYSFVDDPRTCTSDHTGESHGLRSVLERHHRATIIVAAETLCAFNRVTGQLAAWVEVVRSRERRIFVTTEAPDRWTDRESALEEAGFVVLPATEGGWRVLANVDSAAPAEVLFPAPYTRPYPGALGGDELRWLDRNAPPAEEVARLVKELTEFLGPDGFAWLCACAVYPEISWAMTLRVKGIAGASTRLPALARLPWFRHGFMPAWLRRALVAHIPPAEDARLRTDLERLLEELAAGQSRAASGSLLQIGRWIGPLDLMRAAPAGSPLQDHVFLGFMAGRRDALWLDAPRALRHLFSKAPSSVPGDAPSSRGLGEAVKQLLARIRFQRAISPVSGHLMAAAAIGLLSLVPLATLLTIGEITGSPQTMWFVEIPDDDAAMSQMLDGRAFFMSRTEVTVGQYNACVAAGKCASLGPAGTDDPSDWPVRNVSYAEAEQFCKWLQEKLAAAGNAAGAMAEALAGTRDGGWQVTLPTGDKWKWASRGGRSARYPWGEDLDAVRANVVRGFTLATPAPVGSFPRDMGPFGLVDMAGNVAEWTRTPDRGDQRQVLGGSFSTMQADLAGALNNPRLMRADERAGTVGFRVALAPVGPPVSAPPVTASPSASAPPPNAVAPPPESGKVNSAPTIGGIRQSPAGIGLPPTQFTFTVEDVADPDGDALTYNWTLAGESRRTTTPTITALFKGTGSQTVSVSVADATGASASASTQVQIGSLSGTWEITCSGGPKAFPSFPTSFVARIRQDGNRVSGILEGGGRSQTFPAPDTLENTITSPRRVSFGVEGYYNVWADRDGDFYFSVTLDERLQTMTGTSQYCQSVRGVRARAATMKK